jgi:transcriptional regulator with XRE-family HTH domain
MCTAERHDTWSAYRYDRCRCPGIVERVHATWRRRSAGRRTGRGQWSRAQHVDEVAVRRAMTGERMVLTIPERREAVRQLTKQGMSTLQIAHRLGISDRSVARHRAATREEQTQEEQPREVVLDVIVAQLRERRIASGYSVNRLAREAGVDQATVRHLESGHTRGGQLQTVRVIAAVLGLELVLVPADTAQVQAHRRRVLVAAMSRRPA